MNPLYKKYDLYKSVPLTTIWLLMLFVIFGYTMFNSSNFFNFGPSNAKFLSMEINTWFRWIILVSYSFTSQLIYTYVHQTISPYKANVIRDHKSKKHLNKPLTLYIVMLYTLYDWLHSILLVMLALSLQFQFYFPAMIADIIMTTYTTIGYIKVKTEQDQEQFNTLLIE